MVNEIGVKLVVCNLIRTQTLSDFAEIWHAGVFCIYKVAGEVSLKLMIPKQSYGPLIDVLEHLKSEGKISIRHTILRFEMLTAHMHDSYFLSLYFCILDIYVLHKFQEQNLTYCISKYFKQFFKKIPSKSIKFLEILKIKIFSTF